jgi:hypothetical protein
MAADGVASPATPAGAPQGKAFVVILLLAAVVGAAVSLAAWGLLPLPAFGRPTVAGFGWTILLALAISLVCLVVVQLGRHVQTLVMRRPFVLLPGAGLLVAGLAITFSQVTGSPRLEAAAPAPVEAPRPAADATAPPAIRDARPAGMPGGA